MSCHYLFDTNIISELGKPLPNETVKSKMKLYSIVGGISAVSWYELLKGVKRMPNGAKKTYVSGFLRDMYSDYEIISYDEKCAEIQSSIYAYLEKIGKITPFQDTQITATAIANDLVLVTRNVKDFNAIADIYPLKIENWFEK